jgi:hypothetical protein
VPGFAGGKSVQLGDAEERGALNDDLVAGAKVFLPMRDEPDKKTPWSRLALYQLIPTVPQTINAGLILKSDYGRFGERKLFGRVLGLDPQGLDGFIGELKAFLTVGGRHGVAGTDTGRGFFFPLFVTFFPLVVVFFALLMSALTPVLMVLVAFFRRGFLKNGGEFLGPNSERQSEAKDQKKEFHSPS